MLTYLINAWRESSAGRWWRTKAGHERLIYAALAAVVTAALLWIAAWHPLVDWHAQEMRRLDNAQRLLEWMTLNEERARAAAKGEGQRNEAGTGSILPAITQAAEAAGIRLARLQPGEWRRGVGILGTATLRSSGRLAGESQRRQRGEGGAGLLGCPSRPGLHQCAAAAGGGALKSNRYEI